MAQESTALEPYFAACHGRVSSFVDTHFAYPGAWLTNRMALGLDLLRAPLNLAWAPFYVLSHLLAPLAGFLGLQRTASALRAAPPGLRTDVQRYVESRIEEDLLDLAQNDVGTPVQDGRNLPENFTPTLPEELKLETLSHYGSTRTAAADIGNSLASTLVGAFALKAFTPGGVAIGLYLAAYLAQMRAENSFWFGKKLGALWYGMFPVQPTAAETALGIGLTLAVLATVASLSGLILDPMQRRLGLHQRRLHRLLDALERDASESVSSRYRPADPLLARILDAIDAARGAMPYG